MRSQIREEEDIIAWLKKEKLPHSHEAVEMLMNEAEFIRFYNEVWVKRDHHMKPMNEQKHQIYRI